MVRLMAWRSNNSHLYVGCKLWHGCIITSTILCLYNYIFMSHSRCSLCHHLESLGHKLFFHGINDDAPNNFGRINQNLSNIFLWVILIWNRHLVREWLGNWNATSSFLNQCWYPSKPSGQDDVIKWKHFPRYWPFVRGIHRSPVNSPHKGQWRTALMFTLICVWINGCANNRKVGDLRRYCAHYGVTVMRYIPLTVGQELLETYCQCKI